MYVKEVSTVGIGCHKFFFLERGIRNKNPALLISKAIVELSLTIDQNISTLSSVFAFFKIN